MITLAPLVGVLSVQGDVREHVEALTAAGARTTTVRRPHELAAVHGLVLPGGESTTISRLLATFDLLDPLRARLADGMPAFGSCAGMILLAKDIRDGRPDQHQLDALDVVVRRNAFGRQVDSFEEKLTVAGVPGGPVHAVFIRAPWVASAADHVDVIARLPDAPEDRTGAGRIVAVRQDHVLATAFHPELTDDNRVHQMFVRMVRAR